MIPQGKCLVLEHSMQFEQEYGSPYDHLIALTDGADLYTCMQGGMGNETSQIDQGQLYTSKTVSLCINNLRVLFPNAMMAHSPDLIQELHALCENPMPQRLSRRAAQGMQKRMTCSAFALDEELTNKEKKLHDQSLLSQSALILELWMVLALLIAAIKKISVLKPSCTIYMLPLLEFAAPQSSRVYVLAYIQTQSINKTYTKR